MLLTCVLFAAGALRLEPDAPLHDPATSSWIREERAAPSEPVTFTVGLQIEPAARARLEAVFWAVSTPGHADYGKHLSNAQVTALLGVSDARVSAVAEHFNAAGASSVAIAPNRDMLTVTMGAGQAEALLSTVLHWFKHARAAAAPRLLRSASGYALDDSIAAHVSIVGELLQFPHIAEKMAAVIEKTILFESEAVAADPTDAWPQGCDDPACAHFVSPAVLAARYKLPSSDSAASGTSMSVAEFQGQYFKESDLATFGTSCHVSDVTVAKVIGGDRPVAGVEAELDIEYIKAVAPGVPLTVIYSARYSLLDWCKQISSMDDPPLVHSVSYGNDERQQTSEAFMETANTAFMKAGARGLSILFASGDQGVCGREGCGGIFKKRFKPDFPAGSPYITAVGGTDFVTKSKVGPEKAWVASGGGFSDTFGTPSYQSAAVAAYLASPEADLPPKGMWNATGRGYPDVSALGGQLNPYCVVSGGNFEGVAGTSASAPVVAGVFALLNGLRLAANKPPLGFLNPFIYANAHAFQDVKAGKNTGGAQMFGFKAVKGWDPATGVGTPDFEALSRAV